MLLFVISLSVAVPILIVAFGIVVFHIKRAKSDPEKEDEADWFDPNSKVIPFHKNYKKVK